jgi:hypothetical protein
VQCRRARTYFNKFLGTKANATLDSVAHPQMFDAVFLMEKPFDSVEGFVKRQDLSTVGPYLLKIAKTDEELSFKTFSVIT